MIRPPEPGLEGPIRAIGTVLREDTPEILAVLDRLSGWLHERGIELRRLDQDDGRAEGDVDLVIALGGDGTLLRAARWVVGRGVPVLGVNLGRLGFLTAFPDSDLESGLEAVLGGEAVLDHRFLLKGRVEADGTPDGAEFFALNDIVVHTAGGARVTPLMLRVGSEEVGSFAADGLIMATPTGSTAYSMSAGGPIVVPDVECIVITPICPHSLAVRPLVVPAYRELRIRSVEEGAEHQVTVDGQVKTSIGPSQTVVVAREDVPVALVRVPGQTFFSTLTRKLNWASRPPERA